MVYDRNDFNPFPLPSEIINKPNIFRWLLARSISFLLYFPLLGGLLRHSFSLVCFQIALLHQNGEYQRMYHLLAQILQSNAYRSAGKENYWWFFMRLIVAFMQEQQIRQLLINPMLEEQLITLGNSGPGEKRGYNVAYSFVGYSLWLFERALVQEAIEMIKIATTADPSWGYPEYLHGWYGLFVNNVDSVSHFSNAVHIDWNFLHRIHHDRTCQQFPEIIKEVNKKVLVAEPSNKSPD